MDHLLLAVEEHIRIVGSVKVAYNARLKAHSNLLNAEALRSKRLDNLNKLEASSKLRTDKIAMAKQEILESESQYQEQLKAFEQLTSKLVMELDRVDREKVADFSDAMKSFLVSAVETQQRTIDIWTAYEQ